MSNLSPNQMWMLDEACKPIVEAFGPHLYLVGTAGALTRADRAPRDVDVRLMLDRKAFNRLKPKVRALLSLTLSRHLSAVTGLPVDFCIQDTEEANHRHAGMRNPIGRRDLGDYLGDATPGAGDGERRG